jgi:hypothetical protein
MNDGDNAFFGTIPMRDERTEAIRLAVICVSLACLCIMIYVLIYPIPNESPPTHSIICKSTATSDHRILFEVLGIDSNSVSPKECAMIVVPPAGGVDWNRSGEARLWNMEDGSTTFIYNQTIKLEYHANSSSINSRYLEKGDLFVIDCTDNGGIPRGPWHASIVYMVTTGPMMKLNWKIATESSHGPLLIANSGPQDPMEYYGFIDRTDPRVIAVRSFVVIATIGLGLYATYRIWKSGKKR